jgi:hypothetical protein
LQDNIQAFNSDRQRTPPREGPSLLQGLAICGRCGQRMTVRYHTQKGQLIPSYLCQHHSIEHAKSQPCQVIRGWKIDEMIGQLLVETVTPTSIEIALAIQQEVEARFADVQKIHLQQVTAAKYEAELAKRRYQQVDPDNRLVASTLESEWNQNLQLLEKAQANYNEQQQKKECLLDAEQKQAIMALATDFPKMWQSENTQYRERKRIIRLLIEDVTLHQDKEVIMQIRFKGGTTKTLTSSRLKKPSELYATSDEVVAKIDGLLDNYTDAQVAAQLNEQGFKPGRALLFNSIIVKKIRYNHHLKSYYDRLHEKGFITIDEIARLLSLSTETIKKWRRCGRIKGYVCDDKGEYLYEPLNGTQIKTLKATKHAHMPCKKVVSNRTNEV